jgi:lysophospholipase L1-like esterase
MALPKSTLVSVLGAGAGLLVLLGLGKRSSGATVTPSQGRPEGRVLLVGDSFAVGLKAPLAALSGAARVPFEGHGVAGSHISEWAGSSEGLEGYLASFRPTHVLISLGTNDAAGGGTSTASVQRVLSKVQAARAVPLWIGPPTLPFPDPNVRSTVRATGVLYFPSETLSIPRAGDGLHPTGPGYTAWANAIWNWMKG